MRLYKIVKNNFARFINRVIPVASDLNKKDLKKIRKIISKRYASNFRIKNVKVYDFAQSYDKNRMFFILKLSDGHKDLSVFVKSQKYLYKRTNVIKELSKLNLPIPSFYGDFMRNGNIFSVWKYYHSERIVDFSRLDDLMLANIAERIAVFNVNGVQDNVCTSLQNGALWAEPVSEYVSKTFKLSVNAEAQLKLLAEYEGHLLSILNSKCQYFLNHNDVKENNIIMGENADRILLSDFDTLSFGPLGLSLRKFSSLKIRRRKAFVSSYTMSLRKMGVHVCDKYIHQMMIIQQIFWGLHTGIAFNQPRRVERILELFNNNFSYENKSIILNGIGPVRKVKPPIYIKK